MLQAANVATPDEAATLVAVQPSAPGAGPPFLASTTLELSVVTTLPLASSTLTAGWVPKLVPSITLPTGCVVKASLLAAPTLMTTLPDAPVAVSAPSVADRVYVPAAATPVIWQPVKAATPATAAMFRPPRLLQLKVPAPGPVFLTRATVLVSPVTTLLLTSSTETVGMVPKLTASETPPAGWVVITNFVAAPGLITTLPDAPVAVSAPSVAARV